MRSHDAEPLAPPQSGRARRAGWLLARVASFVLLLLTGAQAALMPMLPTDDAGHIGWTVAAAVREAPFGIEEARGAGAGTVLLAVILLIVVPRPTTAPPRVSKRHGLIGQAAKRGEDTDGPRALERRFSQRLLLGAIGGSLMLAVGLVTTFVGDLEPRPGGLGVVAASVAYLVGLQLLRMGSPERAGPARSVTGRPSGRAGATGRAR